MEPWHAIFDSFRFLVTLPDNVNLATASQEQSASLEGQRELRVILDVWRAIQDFKDKDKTLGSVSREKSFVNSPLPFSGLGTTREAFCRRRQDHRQYHDLPNRHESSVRTHARA